MIKRAVTVGFLTPVLLWTMGFAVSAQADNGMTMSPQPQQDGVTTSSQLQQDEATTNPQPQDGAQNLTANDENLKVQPFNFGLGTLVTWTRDAGEPGSSEADSLEIEEDATSMPDQQDDPQQYGLYLQKNTKTDNLAAAGAEITGLTPLPAADLKVLAFDIPGAPDEAFGVANGYCSTGAPRFTVESDSANPCLLGCSHGTPTQEPTTGWWKIEFEPPFSQYPGCEGDVTGTVKSISIIFDEGNDTGPGNVIVDNLRVNDKVAGKPIEEGEEGSGQGVSTVTQTGTSANATSARPTSVNDTSANL